MKKHIFFFFFYIFTLSFNAQQWVNDTLTRTATIKISKNGGNLVMLDSETTPLNQIAGAPKAFYTYYWEFGDGHFSKEKAPKHIYKTKRDYDVRLWVTNNYDTGKAPTSRPKKIKVSTITADNEDRASMNEDFMLSRNREPLPQQDMVVIMRYKNAENYTTQGKLYLFYNDDKFREDNFELLETRTHYNEIEYSEENLALNHNIADNKNYLASLDRQFIASREVLQDSTQKANLTLTLQESKKKYKNWVALKFEGMKPKEERNVFFSLKTTPEMIKDTSAIISVRGVYVPDVNYDKHHVKEMEMEVVTSHDPNKMSSNSTYMNYRKVRFETPKFKIKFQNNGEGPAQTIRLETDIPDMFDKSSIRVLDMYPKCEICPKQQVSYSCLDTTYTNTQAVFTFKNVYLPGSNQKQVKDRDSTKGFVAYSIKFAKDFHKKPTSSKTAIIFDKNEPIYTNHSTTNFLPGISVGAKAGYNAFTDLKNSESYFIGATISPYKSYRWYLQAELLNSLHNFKGNTLVREEFAVNPIGVNSLSKRTTTTTRYKNIDWDIPLLVRYNVNNYIGLGAGLQTSLSVSEKSETDVFIEEIDNSDPDVPRTNNFSQLEKEADAFSNLRNSILFEATLGFARIGPSLGARYVMDLESQFNHWQFYAIWKF